MCNRAGECRLEWESVYLSGRVYTRVGECILAWESVQSAARV